MILSASCHRDKGNYLDCYYKWSSFCFVFCSSDLPRTTFGFCRDTNRLVDTHELLQAAKAHSLPGLGVCLSRNDLLQILNERLEPTGT